MSMSNVPCSTHRHLGLATASECQQLIDSQVSWDGEDNVWKFVILLSIVFVFIMSYCGIVGDSWSMLESEYSGQRRRQKLSTQLVAPGFERRRPRHGVCEWWITFQVASDIDEKFVSKHAGAGWRGARHSAVFVTTHSMLLQSCFKAPDSVLGKLHKRFFQVDMGLSSCEGLYRASKNWMPGCSWGIWL